ncbi:hypothetical protein Anapl_11470 [Anas platyrhynchos]|uniref:Uncharacterized protein n=1 Tax=Anas platyrhynchos TaxID=8839 RepID=R0LK00_ANAPL|nr:hypothetical protein Anapl_11470 [Anas platyrhynchos]
MGITELSTTVPSDCSQRDPGRNTGASLVDADVGHVTIHVKVTEQPSALCHQTSRSNHIHTSLWDEGFPQRWDGRRCSDHVSRVFGETQPAITSVSLQRNLQSEGKTGPASLSSWFCNAQTNHLDVAWVHVVVIPFSAWNSPAREGWQCDSADAESSLKIDNSTWVIAVPAAPDSAKNSRPAAQAKLPRAGSLLKDSVILTVIDPHLSELGQKSGQPTQICNGLPMLWDPLPLPPSPAYDMDFVPQDTKRPKARSSDKNRHMLSTWINQVNAEAVRAGVQLTLRMHSGQQFPAKRRKWKPYVFIRQHAALAGTKQNQLKTDEIKQKGSPAQQQGVDFPPTNFPASPAVALRLHRDKNGPLDRAEQTPTRSQQ